MRRAALLMGLLAALGALAPVDAAGLGERTPAAEVTLQVVDASGDSVAVVPQAGDRVRATGEPVMMRDGPRTIPAVRVVTAGGEVWLLLLVGEAAGAVARTRQGLPTEIRGTLERTPEGPRAGELLVSRWRPADSP